MVDVQALEGSSDGAFGKKEVQGGKRKMKKGTGSRILAYVLTLCMIIGSITWPEITAKAETITKDLKPDTGWKTVTAATDEWSDYGKAEIRFSPSSDLASMKAIADAGYKTLKITYAVDKFTAASGQNAGVMPFASYGSSWSNNDKWIDLSKTGQFETVLDLASISTTSTEKVAFGIQVANLQENSTIKFRIVSAVLSGTKSTSGGSSGESGGSGDSGSGSADLDSIGNTSSSVTASLADGDGTAKGDGYYETEITINNKSNSYIADWIAVADVNGSVTAVKDYSSWSALKGIFSDGKLYIYPNTSKKSGAVNAGSRVRYSKLGYTGTANGVSITGVKVYYSSQSGAFDSFIGSLSSSSGGAGDNTGEINTDVEYNYAKLLQESLYLYDANMCGSDVSAKSEFSWRSNCHTEDAKTTYNGKTVDVSGGYHDAGDHAKFGLPQAYSATVLGLAHMEFAEAFADTATEAHYKRIMDRFVNYFERCTVLGSDGSVQAFCYQVGDGNVDHGYWGAPEKQSSRSGQATFTSDSDTCTDIVSETAAALAAYYINYKDKKALSYAEKLFTYADTKAKKNSSGPASGFYNSDSWEDDYALAAALLYKATGKSAYATKYNNVYGGRTNPNWALCWNNVAQAALLYSPNSSKKSVFVENQSGLIASKTQSGDNNFCLIDSWGSARYNTAHQMTGLMYDTIYGKNDYSSWANGQMKYILGNNAGSKCFVVGYNKYSSKYPHHRASSGYQGSVTGNAYTKQAHVLVGALVGGPAGSSTSYVDSSEDYNQNEVALDYNASLVGAAAGLYLYVKNSGTDEEKTAQKVVPKSEVSSELRTISGESGGNVTTETTTKTTTTEKATKNPSSGSSTGSTGSTSGSGTGSSTEKTTESSTETQVIPVKGITFDKTALTMKVGESGQIKATVTPADATDSSLVWTSSDRTKVSVQNGKITALAAGTATITAKAKDGSGVKAGCKVKVLEPGKLSCETSGKAWNALVYGYEDVSSERIGLSNCGETELSDVKASLKTGSNFQITVYPAGQIAAGQETAVEVRPVTGLAAGNYSDTLVITTANGTANILIKAKVAKAENTASVSLAKKAVSSSSVTVESYVSGTNTGVEYAISTVPVDDADSLTWQDGAYFAGLKAFTKYYVYGRMKATSNLNAGAMSKALEIVTLVSDPYTIDVGRLGDSEYVGALVDGNGNPTVRVSESGGNILVSFTQSGDYTVTGDGADVAVDTGKAGSITIDSAVVKKLTVDPGNSGTFVISVLGNNIVSDGIKCMGDSAGSGVVKINGNGDSSVIVSSTPDAPAVKADGDVEISGIKIKSEGKGVESAGTVKISGGSNKIEAVSEAVAAKDVEMTGGLLDATSTALGEDESVISADNSIKLVGGKITADASGSSTGGSFGVRSDDGKIIVDGDAVIGGDPTYSKDPVDSTGESIVMVKVTFVDENDGQICVSSFNKGSILDISKLDITTKDGVAYSASKPGYSLTWTDQTGKTYAADALYGAVDGDITLKAVWTWITVDISKSAKVIYKATQKASYKATYTGAKITPAVVVSVGNTTLVSGTDYTVTYSSNINAGTAKAVVKGKGKYKGTVTLTFAIAKRDIKKAKVAVSAKVLYTGKAVKPNTKVVYGKTKLTLNKNYKITCYSNKNFGKAKVVITGIGNYGGSVVRYFNIVTKAGKVYTYGNYRYKITNASTSGRGTVTLVSAVKKTTSVTVPDAIKLGGKKFKVTAIGGGAFKGNTKLAKVVISKNVKTIGSKAFYGCKNLKALVVRNTAMTTKTVGAAAFTGTYAKMTVKVPASKLAYYKKLLVARGVSKKAVIKK